MYLTRRLLRSTLSPSQCNTPTTSSSPDKMKSNALTNHINKEPFDPKELYYGYQRVVDARDSKERWSEARILDLNESERLLFVHYIGWNSRYDEWVARERITAHGRHTKAKRKPPESWDGKTSLFRRRGKRRTSIVPVSIDHQDTDTSAVIPTSPYSPVKVRKLPEANDSIHSDATDKPRDEPRDEPVRIEVASIDGTQGNEPKERTIDLELTIDVHADPMESSATRETSHKKAKKEQKIPRCTDSDTEINGMEEYAIEGPNRTTKKHLAAIFRSRLQQSYRVEGYQMYMGPTSPTESALEAFSLHHNPSYSAAVQCQSFSRCARKEEDVQDQIGRMEQEAYHQQTLALRKKNLQFAVESEELLKKSSALWHDQSHAFRVLDSTASPTNASTSSESSPKIQSTNQSSEADTGQSFGLKEKGVTSECSAKEKESDALENGKDEANQKEEDEILYEFVL